MKIATVAFAAILASSGAALAASPFVGTWKTDIAKSTFTGDTMTFTQTPTGYHFVGGPVAYDFADNGKPYPSMADRTVVWTKNADGSWDVDLSVNGRLISRAHRALSADGSTLNSTYEEHRADGSVVHESDVYTRISGGPGLLGTWKSTKVDAATQTVIISPDGAAGYRIAYPGNKVALVTKLDGSPTPVSGPNIPAHANAAFRKVDDHKWTFTDYLGDKPITEGVMTVSPDGATLTNTNWAPGKQDEKEVDVYDRQ